MRILNATVHNATPEEIAAGVIEPAETDKAVLEFCQTFDELPSAEDLEHRAAVLADYISECAERYGCDAVLIDPPSFFAACLEQSLTLRGAKFCYPFGLPQCQGVARADSYRHVGLIWKGGSDDGAI